MSFLKAKTKSEGNLFCFRCLFLEALDEGLFLSFQISGNLWEIHGNTLIVLNPSWSIKTVKTCHGCSMLGLQFYPLALPKNVENGGVLGLCSRSLSSGLYLLGQPRRIAGTTAMMGGFCYFCPLFPTPACLGVGVCPEAQLTQLISSIGKKTEMCVKKFCKVTAEKMVEEKGQLPCPLSYMQDGMIPRLLSLSFIFDDCHQGMVSEPPRDPFSDAKLATQKLFEMDWKCQDGASLLYSLCS